MSSLRLEGLVGMPLSTRVDTVDLEGIYKYSHHLKYRCYKQTGPRK